MIKFWDRVFLLIFIITLYALTEILALYGIVGFITLTVLWILFWNWLDNTFISISYVKETIAKEGNNDNKGNSGSDT